MANANKPIPFTPGGGFFDRIAQLVILGIVASLVWLVASWALHAWRYRPIPVPLGHVASAERSDRSLVQQSRSDNPSAPNSGLRTYCDHPQNGPGMIKNWWVVLTGIPIGEDKTQIYYPFAVYIPSKAGKGARIELVDPSQQIKGGKARTKLRGGEKFSYAFHLLDGQGLNYLIVSAARWSPGDPRADIRERVRELNEKYIDGPLRETSSETVSVNIDTVVAELEGVHGKTVLPPDYGRFWFVSVPSEAECAR